MSYKRLNIAFVHVHECALPDAIHVSHHDTCGLCLCMQLLTQ